MNPWLCISATLVVLAAGPDKLASAEGHPAEMARMEERARTLRAMGVAEALDLDTAEALKVNAQMKAFDDKRRPLRQQVHESLKVLRQAADGDAASGAQVDDAIQKVVDGRAKLAQVDREMFAAVSQGRSPQARAKLALFLAHFHEEMRGMHGGPGGPQGPGAPRRP